MRLIIKLCVICIVLFNFEINSIQSQTRDCSKRSFKNVDEIIAKLVTFGKSGRKFPESLQEVPKYCDESKSMIERIESLNKKCLKDLPKRVLSLVIYSTKKLLRQLCRPKPIHKRLTELIDSAKCLNNANDQIQKCYDIAIQNFIDLKQAEQKQKIPMACCSYHKKNSCITKIADKNNNCTEAHVDLAIWYAESISGNALNLVCPEFSENSDKCDSFKLLSNLNKAQQQSPKPKSFLLPLIDLFESIS